MVHGISEGDWNDYLEGTADDKTRDRIESHLIGCLSCWELNEEMARVTHSLRREGRAANREMALQDDQLREGMRKVFTRIENHSSSGMIRRRLDALAAVMAPMCGSQTALNALRAAAQFSPAQSLEKVTDDNWTPFLKSLTSIASVMCGKTGADLVYSAGSDSEIESRVQ